MIKCLKCNIENNDEALYCRSCRVPLKEIKMMSREECKENDQSVSSSPSQPQDKHISQPSTQEEPKNIREPILAAVLSFIYMGLGQAYNGQRRKGYMFFSSVLFLIGLYFILHKIFGEPMPKKDGIVTLSSPSYVIVSILWFVVFIFNIYDAYNYARKINKGEIIVEATPGKSAFIFLRNVILSVIAFIIAIPLLILSLIGTRGCGALQCSLAQKPKQAIAGNIVVNSGSIAVAAKQTTVKKQKNVVPGNDKKITPVPNASQAYRIDGILYSKDNSLVMVNGDSYRLLDLLCGGQITKISPEAITIKFPDKEEEYRIGDTILGGK